MSLPPSRPYPPDGSSSQFLLPPATPPPPKRTVGSYLNYPLWKNLGQQAARHRYWMKGAAIAYGIVCCFLLSSFMAIAAASLWAPVAQGLANGLQRWVPAVVPPTQAVIAEISAAWPLNRRWWLFLLTTGASLALWCKVVGLTQQIIRSDGDLASHLIPTLRQRSLTGLVAIATAALTLLAGGGGLTGATSRGAATGRSQCHWADSAMAGAKPAVEFSRLDHRPELRRALSQQSKILCPFGSGLTGHRVCHGHLAGHSHGVQTSFRVPGQLSLAIQRCQYAHSGPHRALYLHAGTLAGRSVQQTDQSLFPPWAIAAVVAPRATPLV
jgi:hypothetical protein